MPKGPWEKKGPVLPALTLSWSLTLLQNGEKPCLLESMCCNHQCKIIQELVSGFVQSPVLLLIREEAGSMEALSCSQADQFEIQYLTELIWNEPLTSGWKGTAPCASSEWFLADIPDPAVGCAALEFPSVLKVTWKA